MAKAISGHNAPKSDKAMAIAAIPVAPPVQLSDPIHPTSAIIFTARRYAISARYMPYSVVVCVCLSVCLSQVGILLKRLNVVSRK